MTRAASSSRPPHRRTHRQRVASGDGYFAPESVIRRVGNEPLVSLLGGGPAVLLQVAHPLVAAGVVRHSAYEDDLWKRFMRTMEALYLIVYGSRREADRAGEIVRAVHAAVRGRTEEPLGPFPAGTVYSAADPQLMLWVHATLVETSLAVFRRFAGALTEAEREAYSREMGIVARVFGVWPTLLPRTFADFREYLAAQLDGPEIVVTATGAGRRRSNPPRAASGRAASAVPAHRLSTTVRPDLRLLALLRELSAGLTLPHEPGAVERHWEWRLEAVLERDFPTRRSRASDRLDVLALAVALPRCRLVTCDAFMADVVRRTGLDVRFRCELFTGRRVDVERLRGRLKSLS